MNFAASIGVALIAVSLCQPVEAQERPKVAGTIIPTSAFAGRSEFASTPVLSPDGQRAAISLEKDDKRWVGVVGLDSGSIERRVPLLERHELQTLTWAGNRRLLVTTAVQGAVLNFIIRVQQTYVVDLDTGQSKEVAFGSARILYVQPEGEFILVESSNNKAGEREVRKFWLDGRGPSERITGRKDVVMWLADNSGAVRLGLGFKDQKLQIWYRENQADELRLAAAIGKKDDDKLWDVVRLIQGSNEGYTIALGPSGHRALRRFNLLTHQPGEVLYENPKWDVTDADFGEDGKPIAVHFTDDRARTVWLDPETAALQVKLEKALGNDVFILERALDGSKVLLATGSASDPGAYYVYDRHSRQLKEFAKVRPRLDPTVLSPVKPVSYAARDGTTISGYLALPRGREPRGLPLIVLPHGGPYGVRDTLEYSDEVQLLASRGYAVLQPNFRGSGGFGDAFQELGKGEIGRRMQDDLDDGVNWAVSQGIADSKRVCLVGSSYGGYAALWGVVRNPERYRCAASFAGVTDWDSQLKYDADFFDRDERRAWRDQVKGKDHKFDLDSVSPLRQASLVSRPILLSHGKLDNNVPFDQFERMRKALDRAHIQGTQYLVLDNSGHGFASEKDEQAWYDALLAFLDRNNPAYSVVR